MELKIERFLLILNVRLLLSGIALALEKTTKDIIIKQFNLFINIE